MKLQEAIKTDKFKNPQHMASLNVLYTAYWFKSNFNEVLKKVNLTVEQFNVMRILKGKHPAPMCVKDIAGRMLEKSSNVPRIIDRLEAKKLVSRNVSKEDKRETLIALTAQGLKKLNIANDAMDNFYSKLFGVTDAEAEQLNELLEKFRKTEADDV